MGWLRWCVVLATLLLGCWMIADGIRALRTGDYFTPREGAHKGQLGPWADLLQWAGVDPRAPVVKWTFVLLGAGWILATIGWILRVGGSGTALVVLGLLSLWYLPFGTLLSLLIIALIFWLRRGG